MTEAELTRALDRLRNPADDALETVRGRVLREVKRGKARTYRWLAAAAACLVIGLAFGIESFLSAPAELMANLDRPAPPGLPAVPLRPAVKSPVKRVRRRPALVASAKSMKITMLTDDPNVVIIWLVDGKS